MTFPSVPDESRWASMPLTVQMANLGSEVGRTANWLAKGKDNMAFSAYIRALDLFDLTIKYGRKGADGKAELLKELCRGRDLFTGSYMDRDLETLRWLDHYFLCFSKAVRSSK